MDCSVLGLIVSWVVLNQSLQNLCFSVFCGYVVDMPNAMITIHIVEIISVHENVLENMKQMKWLGYI